MKPIIIEEKSIILIMFRIVKDPEYENLSFIKAFMK